jgi:CheY-like chemotaxis protein
VAKHYFNRFRTAAESKGLTYSVQIEQPEIYADANSRFIEQIIANLLDNAIKFTIEGEIVCRAGIRNGNNTADAFIEIKDTGIGIRKKDQDIIFNEFRQASEGLSRLFEGSGLGLSVVKKMSEKMNANITLESEPGKGSTFTVTLPIKEEYKTEKSVKGSQPGQKHLALEDKTGEKPTLLYVENNETNVEITQLYLEDDYILHHASTGEEALKMIEENKYAAILMDIHLGSGINGVETTKRLRKLPGCADIPVIALTGYTMQDEKNRFREEGIKYYLAKPFTEQELLSQLDEVLRQKQ